jgi:hypothetical protein
MAAGPLVGIQGWFRIADMERLIGLTWTLEKC